MSVKTNSSAIHDLANLSQLRRNKLMQSFYQWWIYHWAE